MKRSDQIKALDNVGLAELLLGNHCKVCYQWDEANGCKLGNPMEMECIVAMTQGLAMELNPMPDLLVGDRISMQVTKALNMKTYVYIGNGMVYRDDYVGCQPFDKIKDYVLSIERFNDDKESEVIWRRTDG